jgi:hypothetical protein
MRGVPVASEIPTLSASNKATVGSIPPWRGGGEQGSI